LDDVRAPRLLHRLRRVPRVPRAQRRGHAPPRDRGHHDDRPRLDRGVHLARLPRRHRVAPRRAESRRQPRDRDRRRARRHLDGAQDHPGDRTWIPREAAMSLADRMLRLDRRIIFILVGIGTALPLLLPVNLPITVTPRVEAAYDTIDALPAGSTIL